MKIHEVERAVGITRKNIRFYEEQGLVHPGRNQENGYREYGEPEVRELKKIKLLRKLALPLEEIRGLQDGRMTLEDGLKRHLILLEHEEKNLGKMKDFCRYVSEEGGQYGTLDADFYLAKMEQIEKEGMHFMNVEQVDQKKKRWRGSLIAGGVCIAFCVWILVLIGYEIFTDDGLDVPEMFLILVLLVFPVIVIAGIVHALIQRKKEIQGGEEDAAAKY